MLALTVEGERPDVLESSQPVPRVENWKLPATTVPTQDGRLVRRQRHHWAVQSLQQLDTAQVPCQRRPFRAILLRRRLLRQCSHLTQTRSTMAYT